MAEEGVVAVEGEGDSPGEGLRVLDPVEDLHLQVEDPTAALDLVHIQQQGNLSTLLAHYLIDGAPPGQEDIHL